MAPPISGMKLTFSEDFNALSLYSRWKPTDQWGNRFLAGNKEQQIYVDPKYKGLGINPFSVNNGVLTIKAAKAGSPAKLGGKKYTSGMLSSHGKGGFSQQYGYFEMRAQLPEGKGMWPAFWLLADHGKWPPELDVMESIGSKNNYAVQSIHSKYGNKGKTTYTSANLQKGFHTYGMNWTKDTISYYLDGKKTAEYKTPADMHSKMHMLLNTAVGGTWPGSPDASTNWSKTNFKIDYVRVYSGNPNAKTVASSNAVASVSSSGSQKAASSSGGDVVLSHAMDASNLNDSFRAGTTSKTYSAAQMAINGVKSPTTVTVSYNAQKDVSVTNNGKWGAIKNVTIKSDKVADVTVRNFVDAELKLSSQSHTINASGLKRGNIVTANGNDAVTVSGRSDNHSANLLTINTGNGNDRVSYTGENDNRVRVSTGNGNDTVTISGKATATVNAGAGNDRINIRTTGGSTVVGGTGRDVFAFMAGAHATISDFKSGDDRIQLSGISAGNVRVRQSGNSTLIDLGSNGRITVAGVAHTANGLHLSYA